MTNNEPIRADMDRLWGSIMEMGHIGATPGGGVGRIALTNVDRQARDLFVTWCEESGCSVRVDRMGNIFARDDRQPSRHAAPGRQVRRNIRRACRTRSGTRHERRRRHHAGAHRRRGVDGRGRRALLRHAGVGGFLRRLHARGRPRARRFGRRDHGRGPGGRRLRGKRAGGRRSAAGVLRGPHRAGTDTRSRRQDHRRSRGCPGTALLQGDGNGRRRPRGNPADDASPGFAARRRPYGRRRQRHCLHP